VAAASCLPAYLSPDRAEQRVSGIAAPPVLLRRLGQQVGRQDLGGRPPDADDGGLAVVVGGRRVLLPRS
jgi:hypothetical protein